MPIRVLIADDHGILRAGLRSLLDSASETEVVGEARDGEEALRLAKELRPDVLLVDISMPGASGIEIARRLRGTLPETRVLILTVHEDQSLIREAIRAGAAGYIIKRAVESELFNAIAAVQRGELYVHPAVTRALLEEDSRDERSASHPGVQLTPRETEVLRLIGDGYTNSQMAELLHIGVRTVETHRANLMGKLGLHSRVELVRYAREKGLLPK
ncbi:MAG: response regulator transcription factor [Gemmatimonadales bacterium]|jgi:DNA-binding NarL/FixJ family response regulator